MRGTNSQRIILKTKVLKFLIFEKKKSNRDLYSQFKSSKK